MASKNKKDRFNSTSRNGGDSFPEHNQRMRTFRLAHPKNWRQWGCQIPGVPERLPALVPPILPRRAILSVYSPN